MKQKESKKQWHEIIEKNILESQKQRMGYYSENLSQEVMDKILKF
jgi:hypothetical protein